jgi:hypothetical protein
MATLTLTAASRTTSTDLGPDRRWTPAEPRSVGRSFESHSPNQPYSTRVQQRHRLRATSSDREQFLTSPSDCERPRCREFASRGSCRLVTTSYGIKPQAGRASPVRHRWDVTAILDHWLHPGRPEDALGRAILIKWWLLRVWGPLPGRPGRTWRVHHGSQRLRRPVHMVDTVEPRSEAG